MLVKSDSDLSEVSCMILQNELIMILNFVLNWTKASSGKKIFYDI